MLRLTTNNQLSYLMIKNPNDSLDFIKSIQNELNRILTDNDEKIVKKIKITYGSNRETSDQKSEEYEGVKAFAFLKKKALSAGNQGYFSGNRDRWKYTNFNDDGTKEMIKYFDNHFKINFKCKTLHEREVLKTLLMVLLTFNQSALQCNICDLDYMEDIETIQDELYEFNIYLYARTVVRFAFDDNQEPLKQMVTKGKVSDYELVTNDKFKNGFI